MRGMSRVMMSMAASVVLLCVGVALARDTPAELLSAAQAAAKKGDVLEAAAGFGKAAAAAQSHGDLQSEADVADGLAEFLNRFPPLRTRRAAPPTTAGATSDETKDAPDQLAAVLAIMEQLDHGHLGAYVSTQALARFVVESAVRTGEPRGLRAAADALEKQAKIRKSGRGVRTLAVIAATMLEGPEAAPLEESFEVCRKAGWGHLAFVVAVETAARHVVKGEADAARQILDSAVKGVVSSAQNEAALRQRVRFLADARLRDAPEDVRGVLEPLRAGGSVGLAGGAGGAGASGGRSLSAVGNAWPKLTKSKPFVTVKRSGDTAIVRQSFQKKFSEEVELDFGEHVQNSGGVALWFCGRDVSLCMVDESGRNGMPGGSSSKSSWRAWYLLADGETWGVSKSGAVTIK